jgi:hypothetical protein
MHVHKTHLNILICHDFFLGLGSNMFVIDESSGIVKTDPLTFDANLLPALGTEIRLQLKVSQQMSFCFFKSWMIF